MPSSAFPQSRFSHSLIGWLLNLLVTKSLKFKRPKTWLSFYSRPGNCTLVDLCWLLGTPSVSFLAMGWGWVGWDLKKWFCLKSVKICSWAVPLGTALAQLEGDSTGATWTENFFAYEIKHDLCTRSWCKCSFYHISTRRIVILFLPS